MISNYIYFTTTLWKKTLSQFTDEKIKAETC